MSTNKMKRSFKKESPNDIVMHKPKSIKIIAEAFSKTVSRWIFAYSYYAFDNVF